MAEGEIAALRKLRATLKRKVTIRLKTLNQQLTDKLLDHSLYKSQLQDIEVDRSGISNYDEKINQIMCKGDLAEKAAEFYEKELEEQVMYGSQLNLELNKFKGFLVEESQSTDGSLAELAVQMRLNETKPPPLQCGNFSGREKDKLAFNCFINQFNAVIGDKKNLSNASKLAYLVGYLRDYALSIVKHLAINDDNYPVAIKLLEKEFLNKQLLIDETLKTILKATPDYSNDPDYISVKVYLNEIRVYVHELAAQGLNFLEDQSAGLAMISHIVFNKLPLPIKSELIHMLGKVYPNLNEIFDKCPEAISILNSTRSVRPKNFKNNHQQMTVEKPKPSSKSHNYKHSTTPKNTFQNYKNTNPKEGNIECKLCGAQGHNMSHCHEYITYENKVARLNQLSLCTRCAGSGHDETQCYGKQGKLKFPCKICGTKEHFTVLCPLAGQTTSGKTNLGLCLAQAHRNIDS